MNKNNIIIYKDTNGEIKLDVSLKKRHYMAESKADGNAF